MGWRHKTPSLLITNKLRVHSQAREGEGYTTCRASKSLQTCRRHAHRPAGTGAPGSDLAEHRCTHFCAAHQSLPVSVEALGMTALCLQTSHSALHTSKHGLQSSSFSRGVSSDSQLSSCQKHGMMCTEQKKAHAWTQLHSECHDRQYACPKLAEKLRASDQADKTWQVADG